MMVAEDGLNFKRKKEAILALVIASTLAVLVHLGRNKEPKFGPSCLLSGGASGCTQDAAPTI